MISKIARPLLITAATIGGWLGLVALLGGQVLGRVPQGANCDVTYVYDGDTLALDCGGGKDVTARLVGFDTPETKRAKCDLERAAGQAATVHLRKLIDAGTVRLSREGIDKYRRPSMRLWLDGQDVAETMIRDGHAVAYRGGKRINWCAELEG